MQKNSLNRVIIVGHVGGDPELKFAKSGIAVTNFSIATNEIFKEKKEKTEWHRIVVFGDSAERIAEWVTKGQLLQIEGRLRTDEWETDNGEKRSSTSIVVDSWTTLSKGKDKDKVHEEGKERDPDLPF